MSIDYCHSHHTTFDTDKWRSCPSCGTAGPVTIIPYEFADVPLEILDGAGIGLLEGHLQIAMYRDDWDIQEVWLDAFDAFHGRWVDRKAPTALASKLVARFLADKKFCAHVDGLWQEAMEEHAHDRD